MRSNTRFLFSLLFSFILGVGYSQNVSLKVSPDPLVIEVNTSNQIQIDVLDSDNKKIKGGKLNIFPLNTTGFVPSSGVLADGEGNLTGKVPGEYNMVIFWSHQEKGLFGKVYLKTTVTNSSVKSLSISGISNNLIVGDIATLTVEVKDNAGYIIENPDVQYELSNPQVASISQNGILFCNKAGKTNLKITSGGAQALMNIEIIPNPIDKISMEVSKLEARTGDVITVTPKAFGKDNKALSNINFRYSVSQTQNADASAHINSSGKFVAEVPGVYTILASSGDKVGQTNVSIYPRNVQQDIKVVGKGILNNLRTTELWVWEGTDGRDYSVTGTHATGGLAYFWDVTDPSSIELIDSIQVDARSVNDVKMSEDGRICVISREGASTRKNGIVILDVSNPRDVKELSTYTQDLTGGVHNLFIYKEHVYALSNGQRYEIINISDPRNPKKVGKFEIDNPARSIHDVWVVDGIAYSSNWNDGLIMVDVGNGIAGGSPSNPIEIGRAKTVGNANHTAFPYVNKTTGQHIVVAGDEIFPTDFDLEKVINPDGYLHFLDMTDVKNPKEIARYKVPEAGSHNFWIENDLLYIGYYNGGLRVVDISGELMGDLYKQGREVTSFLPQDPDGYIPNNAMTWGAMPFKGNIFFTDMNTGLWSVKLEPKLPKNESIKLK